MSAPNVPDPYIALGVAKDAPAQQIKTIYRKLALKYHPDKVTDDSLKAEAADNFHRIQQAYEILSDEDRRGRYDAQVRLAELRKEMIDKQAKSPRVDIRTAAFEVPTQTPGRGAYTARGPERVAEERRPNKSGDDSDYFGDVRTSSRKHADYERDSKKYSSSRDEDRVKASTREKDNVKSVRGDRRRVSDTGRARDRQQKYQYVEDETDSEIEDFVRPRNREDERERERYESKRHRDDRYDYERERERDHDREYSTDRSRKTINQTDHAKDYMKRAGGQRPSVSRTASSRDDYSDRRRVSERPAVMVRRSSARTGSSDYDRKQGRDRDRKYSLPELYEDEDAPPPRSRPAPLEKHHSSPVDIRMTHEPRRSQTMDAKYDNPEAEAPRIRRSETMPVQGTSTSRRKESAPYTSSKLRNTEMNEGLPTPGTTPEYQSPADGHAASTKYRVADEPTLGLSSTGRRTVKREPEAVRETRRVARSPSPVERNDRKGRPSNGRYGSLPQVPPLRTSNIYNHGSPVVESPTTMDPRGRPSPVTRQASERGSPLFGEIPTSTSPSVARKVYDYSDRREDKYRYSPDPDDVKYARKVVPEDVKMASGYRTSRRHTERPGLSRNASYAY